MIIEEFFDMKLLCSILTVLTGAVSFAQSPAISPNLKHQFRFNDQGSFRVMQISDIQGIYPLEEPVKQLIRKGIRKYRPALIILTGDNTNWHSERGKFEKAAAEFTGIFLEEQVPYAITFGNHDSEQKGKEYFTRQEQYDHYKKTGGKYFVDFDIPELSGVGSGAIPLYSAKTGKPMFNLIVMDSGDYATKEKEYDGCRTDQIRWYEENAGVLPCLWFQHIIVFDVNVTDVLTRIPTCPAEYRIIETADAEKDSPEAFFSEPLGKYIRKLPEGAVWSKPLGKYLIPEKGMVWSEQDKRYLRRPPGAIWNYLINSFVKLTPGLGTGVLRERPCSPTWKTYSDAEHTYKGRTLYQSWLKKGNLKGAYFGHDHMNTFDVTDQNGIRLGYCKGATLYSYNDGDPGFRIFDISEDGSYKTETCTASQLGIKIVKKK